jgi:hypothetical protein
MAEISPFSYFLLLAHVNYECKISENGHILALEPLIKKVKALSFLQL